MTVRSQSDPVRPALPLHRLWIAPVFWACAGAVLILLLTQIPARHQVDLGGYDAAYVQGFRDPETVADLDSSPDYLAGSDGSARWAGPQAALIFPQAGLPAEVTLHLRGPAESPVQVTLLLNGEQTLATFSANADWQEQTVSLPAGRFKPNDFFLAVRTEPPALGDGTVGAVLIDRVTYRTAGFPLLPYPAQLLYAALAGGLLALLLRDPRRIALALLGYGLLWLLLYRSPPVYPYPLRIFPPLTVAALGTWLALRDAPPLVARRPWLLGVVAPAAIILFWGVITLRAADAHVTLARPGVENDFRVFATRETLAQVFSADGFYNLGYPLLLWLTKPFNADNAFLAGRFLAALSGMGLLLGGYLLARALLPAGSALLALIVLALSGAVAQYGLYVGSDMPFAAIVALTLAALAWAIRATQSPNPPIAQSLARPITESPNRPIAQSPNRPIAQPLAHPIPLAALAGFLAGLSFLIRHPGLLLLPWGVLALLLIGGKHTRQSALAFGLAFLIGSAPQVMVNIVQTGSPLYNQQAKNIWLAVYGGTDWGRWDEAPNSIGLVEVILRDPGRFLANWVANLRAYVGSGAEDTSEFGRAIQLRLLGWPANWLAIAGLLGWLWQSRRLRTVDPTLPVLLSLIALYVASVATAFALPRFFLPLAPIYAVAAAWAAANLFKKPQILAAATLVLVVVLWSGFRAGQAYVLDLQPADEIAAVQMVETTAPGDELIAARVAARLPLAKYSAIAHRVIDWPQGGDTNRPVSAAELAELRRRGAVYLLWDEAAGPPPLADPAAARLAATDRYGLYQLK